MLASSEASPIERVSIRPGVSILSILRHLNYRPWFALAEFVDNAVQSYSENRTRLESLYGTKFQLRVEIDIESGPLARITVRDNAAGIGRGDFPRAFRPAAIPPDRSGLSEFGMGMKSAACWFSPRWQVRTKALGENVEPRVDFDVAKIVHDQIEELEPAADIFEQRFGPFFNLIYVRSDSAGRVIGHFTLYNTVGWQVVLAEAGGPANQTVALASDPLNPATWSDDASDLPDIPFEWLDSAERDFKPERARERLNRMIAHHRDTGLESEVDRIVKDVFERHGVTGDRVVSDPAVKQAIFDEIATRVTASALGLPHRRPLGATELEGIFQEKENESTDDGCFFCRVAGFLRIVFFK